MTILELADLYATTNALAKEPSNLYRRYARLAHAVWRSQIQQVSELDIQRLAASLNGYTPTTQADIIRRIRTLFRFAHAMRLLADPPRVWPKVRCVQKAPEAWTPQQVARLYRVATRQPGRIGRVRALAALQAIRSARPRPDDLVFQWPDWPKSRRDFFSAFRYLCMLAGVPASRTHCQLTHRWRRSGITIAALQSLEAARRHAGHTRPETTVRHYIDPRLLAKQPPAVPTLEALAKANGNGKARQLWLIR